MITASRRARAPTILQQEVSECGAASLAMVLASHGRWVPLETVREACGSGRDGVRALDIVKAARAQGLAARGLKKDIDGLADLPLPAILFWNFNHFLVLDSVRVKDGRVVEARLVDPAIGPRVALRDELDASFTGVALSFQPGEGFRPTGMRAGLLSIVLEMMGGQSGAIALALTSAALLVVPGLAAAGLSRLFLDGVVIERQDHLLVPVAVAVLGCGVLRAVLLTLQQWTLARGHAATAMQLAARQMWTLLHLKLSFFDKRLPGETANGFAISDRLASLLVYNLAPATLGLVSVVGYGLALLLLDPLLASLAIVGALGSFVVLVVVARRVEEGSRRFVSDEARLSSITVQGLVLLDDHKASAREPQVLRRWASYQAKVIRAEQTLGLWSSGASQASAGLMASVGAAVLVAGGLSVMSGRLSIGALLAFQTLFGTFMGSMAMLVVVGSQLQQIRGMVERLEDLRWTPGAIRRTELRADAEVAPVSPRLSLENVVLAYSSQVGPVVRDLSIDLKPGHSVALVGASGSGKSTVGKLMVGLLQPTSGQVTLGGRALTDWPTVELRNRVAYVAQSDALFEGTVRENLTLWDSTVPDGPVVQACRDAGVHDLVAARPGGYDSRILEGGRNLSGGERQRLAIARALVRNPSILVLDEATSALDPPGEEDVMAALFKRGCALVVIAHRLSTLRDCDEILVFDQGLVVERGRHDDLLALDGAYARLVNT